MPLTPIEEGDLVRVKITKTICGTYWSFEGVVMDLNPFYFRHGCDLRKSEARMAWVEFCGDRFAEARAADPEIARGLSILETDLDIVNPNWKEACAK